MHLCDLCSPLLRIYTSREGLIPGPSLPKHIQFYWLSQFFFLGIQDWHSKSMASRKKIIPLLSTLKIELSLWPNHLYHLSIGLLTSLPNSILGHSKPTQTVCESFRQNHHKFGSKSVDPNWRKAKMSQSPGSQIGIWKHYKIPIQIANLCDLWWFMSMFWSEDWLALDVMNQSPCSDIWYIIYHDKNWWSNIMGILENLPFGDSGIYDKPIFRRTHLPSSPRRWTRSLQIWRWGKLGLGTHHGRYTTYIPSRR